MAKIAPQNVIDFGFTPEQFNTPRNWDGTGGFLDVLITSVALYVENDVGAAAYAAATGVNLERLKNAELYLCASRLWRHRIQYIAAEHAVNRTADEIEADQQRCRTMAENLEKDAATELSGFRGDDEISGLAVGYVETGRFTTSV